MFRCLKPGGKFANYEWIVTDKYDPKNAEHKRVKVRPANSGHPP